MEPLSATRPRFNIGVNSKESDPETVIALSGQLDAHTATEFERFLERTVRTEHSHHIIIDFSKLEYISSAGLGVLMGLIEEVRAEGGDIKLAALPDKIFHILDLLGFPIVFQIFGSVDEARTAFRQ
ncbi:MAG: STAS domain-containing protein [Bacteroidota bacterium]|nr:STAS domain-containing protein [Bacteroidota bacterium]MDP4233885.1 STAS domain-containing protein [Bacteroidota bacterium]MDP4243557.1 STAS domain-containing protein [Bacteroidota bacterium]MDP4288903.1 STAS domain-containing protein [Bacteroidota bacterium]